MENMNGRTKHGTTYNTSLVGLLLLLLLPLVVQIVEVEAAARGGFDPNSEQPCILRDPAMDPTHKFLHGHDVVWQIPPEPKAVLLMAHGANMQSLQYFDPGPNCEQCNGFPETRTAVIESIRRHYAVIAVTMDFGPVPNFGEDVNDDLAPIVSDVYTIVKEWMAVYSLDGLPLTGWGYSAGTFIVTALSQSIPIRALVLLCGEGYVGVEKRATSLTFPPTLFVYMPRDTDSLNVTGKDKVSLAILAARGVEAADTQCFPKPLSPLFFTERILCVSDEMSQALYGALQGAGWLDRNGYLTQNPGGPSPNEELQSLLQDSNILPYCTKLGEVCFLGHVMQELNVAFAVHSFTHVANDVIFNWLDSHVHILSSSGTEDSDLQSPTFTDTTNLSSS